MKPHPYCAVACSIAALLFFAPPLAIGAQPPVVDRGSDRHNVPAGVDISGRYWHDREHDSNGSQRWTSIGNPPPARFRGVMQLFSDGRASVLMLSPDDAHYEAMGTFAVGDGWLDIHYHDHRNARSGVIRYAIVAFTPGVLLLRPSSDSAAR